MFLLTSFFFRSKTPKYCKCLIINHEETPPAIIHQLNLSSCIIVKIFPGGIFLKIFAINSAITLSKSCLTHILTLFKVETGHSHSVQCSLPHLYSQTSLKLLVSSWGLFLQDISVYVFMSINPENITEWDISPDEPTNSPCLLGEFMIGYS